MSFSKAAFGPPFLLELLAIRDGSWLYQRSRDSSQREPLTRRKPRMTATLPGLFREIHRLRKHLRELQTEIERLPRVLKAHQAKVAKQEQLLKEANESVKHQKVENAEKELTLKSTNQQLAKYEKQRNDMKTPKEVEAKEKEIANEKAIIQRIEDEILAGLAALDEKIARVPEFEAQVKKAKAELKAFESDMAERVEHLEREKKQAEKQSKAVEVDLPATVRNLFDRLVKAHGADALAAVKERERACGHCHSTVTAQNVNQLLQGHFLSCTSCGRMLYIDE
jgi:predicted  nucleic acid-binding Zn-ribbon protein